MQSDRKITYHFHQREQDLSTLSRDHLINRIRDLEKQNIYFQKEIKDSEDEGSELYEFCRYLSILSRFWKDKALFLSQQKQHHDMKACAKKEVGRLYLSEADSRLDVNFPTLPKLP